MRYILTEFLKFRNNNALNIAILMPQQKLRAVLSPGIREKAQKFQSNADNMRLTAAFQSLFEKIGIFPVPIRDIHGDFGQSHIILHM